MNNIEYALQLLLLLSLAFHIILCYIFTLELASYIWDGRNSLAASVLSFSQGKVKFHFYKKQVITKCECDFWTC